MTPKELGAALEEALKEVSTCKPEAFPEAMERVRKIREEFHVSLAQQIQPALGRYAQALPQANLEEKRDLSKNVRHLVRSVGLSLKDERGEDAFLRADHGHNREEGRFQLCRTASRGTSIAASSSKLFPLLVGPAEDRHLNPRTESSRKRGV
jgi:hypothetical protein